MTGRLSEHLFQLPTAKAFIERLVSDLSDGRSLLVLLPIGIDPTEVWSLVRKPLENESFDFRTIYLSDLPQDQSPVLAIANTLNVGWPDTDTPRTLINLMYATGLPDIVWLQELSLLPESRQRVWLEFLSDWDEATQSVIDRGGSLKQLMVIDSASNLTQDPPANSTNLFVHWWWGLPSILEMRLLCRLASSEDEMSPNVQWREHTIPNMAANDIPLADFLWDKTHLSQEELITDLRSFAEARGWDTETLKEWGPLDSIQASGHNVHNTSIFPSRELRKLWAEGALSNSREYGVELSSATLAALGEREAIRHRMWRGQVELLSPILDQLRIQICGTLADKYGDDWAARWRCPTRPADTTDSNPLSEEWGDIVHLLSNIHQFRGETQHREQAKAAHKIRNRLYHYQLISFHQFENLDKKMRTR